MKLIFINRYFHPDHSATSQMLSDMAFALAARGRQVHVITSRQRYDDAAADLPWRESVNGVEVHRIWTTRFGRKALSGRAVDYVTFYLSAAWAVAKLSRSGDVVIAKTDPPMLGVLAGPLARLRGARTVNWLQDLFPEVAVALGLSALPRPVLSLLTWLRNRSIRRAAINIAIGERMAERLRNLGVPPSRVRIIPNWSDTRAIVPVPREENALRGIWGLRDNFVVGYSGNLGRAHEIETLLDAIGRIERSSEPAAHLIRWVFIGGGAQFDALAGEVRKRALKTVVFQPYQPRDRLKESLSAADVHLVSLRPELEGFIVPSKFYGVAAAGRAAIFIGKKDGEIARLLDKNSCGVTVAQGDDAALADAVLRLCSKYDACVEMGRNARAAAEQQFGLQHATHAWVTMLRELG